MLHLTIPKQEIYNDSLEEFQTVGPFNLQMEHSLLSISKWESKTKKSFFRQESTVEDTILYFKCMTINKVDDVAFSLLTQENVREIREYIDDSKTATTFKNTNEKKSRELITSELVYYWMTTMNIPFEAEKWHFSRLITLIRIHTAKNTPQKKRSKSELLAENRAINEARRKQFNTKG